MSSDLLTQLFSMIPVTSSMHSPNTEFHKYCRMTLRDEIEKKFSESERSEFGPFGELVFPYHSMGNIDSLNLFDLDEVIIFSFYWQNRHRYNNVLDIGANIGLHSILLSKCGLKVTAFEPEKTHFQIITENLEANSDTSVDVRNAAVSDSNGEIEFVVVKGNTTGSHIAGSKPSPYGDLERYSVQTIAFDSVLAGIDFVKMDVEGHEKEIICNSDPEIFSNFDLMLSIHDEENANAIFEYFMKNKISMYSQKINWNRVECLEDMIVTHHDGSLFVSSKDKMHWS